METYRILSDIFAIPGLLCLFFGLLRWLAGQGAYRGISYIVKNTLRALTLRERTPYPPEKQEQNGKTVLLLTGLILLAVAGIFTGLYYL